MKLQEQKELATCEYWDKRYAEFTAGDFSSDKDNYEWCRKFSDIQAFLTEQLPPPESGCQILHLGCGTSTLTADLYRLGYTRQVNVDFSPVAIDLMRETHKSFEGLVWQIADIRCMDGFDDGTFDIAIDKATLDAMLYGSPWDPDDEVKLNVKKYVDEVSRVLSSGGKWIYVTFRQPHFQKPLLARDGIWDLTVHTLNSGPSSFEYFAYVMTKH